MPHNNKLYKQKQSIRIMGQIIKIKNSPPDKTIVHLKMTQKEAQELKGHYKKIHLFSEDLCTHYAKLIERGTNNSTKYVLIPSILKERKCSRISKISYQKIKTDSKTFYIAIAKKKS